jgi:hypothetical protein
VRKRAFTMLAIDEAPVFQIAQGQSHRDPADVKPPAELMFALDWKSALFRALENFFR